MEKPRASLIELILIYKDENRMGNNSIRQLIKGHWRKLAVINIGNYLVRKDKIV